MNFVFHRHLAERDLSSTLAAVGAMLPDLWRMADRRVRHLRRDGTEVASTTALPIDVGIHHHEEVDRWFHATDEFRDGERTVRERLALRAPETPRLGLFAHVAWEMCLDGALLREVGLEAELDAMREGLEEAQAPLHDSTLLGVTVERHHFSRVSRTQSERDAFDARMARIIRELERGEWIGGYRDPMGLSERLRGVRARFAFSPPTPQEQSRWADAFAELEPLADQAARSLRSHPQVAKAAANGLGNSGRRGTTRIA